MDFHDLDDSIRAAMIAEFERDIGAGELYLGPRLNSRGRERWPSILEDAFRHGGPESLAGAVRAGGLLAEYETARRGGTSYERKVPSTAADTLAEGEFGRYYVRAVCVRAVATGRKVQVYRAKAVTAPRPESEALVGQVLDPAPLLDDLRTSIGGEPTLGISRPNSGLSVRLV